MRWGREKKICSSGIGQIMATIEWPARNAVTRAWHLFVHPSYTVLHKGKLEEADLLMRCSFVQCVGNKRLNECALVWFIGANGLRGCAPLQNRTLLHSQHFQYDQHFCLQLRVLSSAFSWKSVVTSPPRRYIRCSSASRSLAMRLSAKYPATYPIPNRRVMSDKNSGMKKLLGEKFANSFQSSAKLISLAWGIKEFKLSIVCISVIYHCA